MSTREHLVTATMELLWERGYEATSPRAILERSGAGQGSLYHHFKSKADLVATALNEVSNEMQGIVDATLHSNKPPLERVRDYLTQPREALRGCRLGRMIQEPAITQDALLRDPISSYFTYSKRELTAALAQAQQDGTLSPSINVADLATTLIAVVQGGYVMARALQDAEAMEQAIRGALALLEASERR
ncbi:TetR family transcriptional regulator [Ktedonosporobacter rubrisoli]|uniref:TetR family transcriptional regulator n=1 Tax=Ktedonosporobacter rubrisoli TaxID=2509675 RepID=A0A4P6JMV1_KTERU|nr:TetR/AcrR family transcriptional regulator [Ktedonosporobacter rubrisoli]QBD76617.1 TetR family transcriptional regulator [Ktedonosporobacter rubrisoli]